MRIFIWMVALLGALGLGACSTDSDSDVNGDGADGGDGSDSDSDGDSDGDSDSDSDGDGDGDSDGDSDGDVDGGGLDSDNVCQSYSIYTEALPSRVLILQDLSSSLQTRGRWDGLKTAMIQFVDANEHQFRLGLVPFATTILDGNNNDADCTVNRDHVISPVIANAGVIKNKVYEIDVDDLVGGTPTNEALVASEEILVGQDPNDGSARVIILVTDGAPNCLDGNGGDGATSQDEQRVTNTITRLHDEQNTAVYVVGYDLDNSLTNVMNRWADVGGTGTHYPADNTQKLLEQMEAITGSIPCEYVLDEAAPDPSYVRVEIDGLTIPYGDTDSGWTLESDDKTITLFSAACDVLRDGDPHEVAVTVECEVITVQ